MPPISRILIVDSDVQNRERCSEVATRLGYLTLEATDAANALALFQAEPVSLVLLDPTVSSEEGMLFLHQALAQRPETPIVIMTSGAGAGLVKEAEEVGAVGHLRKPVEESRLVRLLDGSDNGHVSTAGPKGLRFGLASVVGESSMMQRIKEMVTRASVGHGTPLLIVGERGTGKRLLARAIHYESSRAERPFLALGCGGQPMALLEAEFFGYGAGAFSNTLEPKPGYLQIAEGGTLCLEDVGELPLPLQERLLHHLSDGEENALEGPSSARNATRIIGVTSVPLLPLVEAGAFREDLYYRLGAMPVQLPPLRERQVDIPALAKQFSREIALQWDEAYKPLERGALEKLQGYAWPGNVRELRDVVRKAWRRAPRALIVADDIVLGRMPKGGASRARGGIVSLPEGGCILEEVERSLLKQALDRCAGNQSRAAELLGISRDQVRYKSRKFKIR